MKQQNFFKLEVVSFTNEYMLGRKYNVIENCLWFIRGQSILFEFKFIITSTIGFPLLLRNFVMIRNNLTINVYFQIKL